MKRNIQKITYCPCPSFDVNKNNCQAKKLDDYNTLPISSESGHDESNPGALSDGCWNIPERVVARIWQSILLARQTAVRRATPRFALSCQTTCAPAGCVKTGNGGARKICYDTDSVTRKQVDSTMNKCESWITMSGSFCIVATEYTMAAQEIYKEFATLPSNRSAETAAVAAYRLLRTIPNRALPQQVVQLEIRTWAPLMARSTCCYRQF